MPKPRPPRADIETEFASRQRDPFEIAFDGIIRANDPLLAEKGGDLRLYRDLKRDGKVYSCMQKRILALVGRPWQVEPVEDGKTKDAEIVSDILKRANFDLLCANLLEALLTGFSVAEIIWMVRDGLVVPKRVVKRAPNRFIFAQDDADKEPALRLLTREAMLKGIPVPERKFIVHRVNAEDDNPYGTGLGLQTYWPVFFKRRGITSWNKLNARIGIPVPWGQYPRHAGPKEKGTLFSALKAMANDGVVMTPEGSAIQLLESKLAGSLTTQQALCEYMDDWIAEVWIGQEPRSKSGGAVAAASKEREAVRLDLTQADSDLLSETLNSTLIAWICEFNGLAPCLVYRVIKAEEDLKAKSETDKNVATLGFRPTLDSIRATYGEGWEEAPAPSPPPSAGDIMPNTANFAEGDIPVPDGIDDIVSGLRALDMEGIEAKMLAPVFAAIDQAIAEGLTMVQFHERLKQLAEAVDGSALAEKIARASFAARLLGESGDQLA